MTKFSTHEVDISTLEGMQEFVDGLTHAKRQYNTLLRYFPESHPDRKKMEENLKDYDTWVQILKLKKEVSAQMKEMFFTYLPILLDSDFWNRPVITGVGFIML